MRSEADGLRLMGHAWLPAIPAKGAVVIAHGMAEHAGRYARFAARLNEAGFAAYGFDHRGHGLTGQAANSLGHMADEDGWNKAVADLGQALRFAQARHPGQKLHLFAHSMGSFLAQRLLQGKDAAPLAACVLCGSNGKPPPLAAIGRVVTRIERLRLGKRGNSLLVHNLSFGAFNKKFEPRRTDFDWLSRDTAEVDKYIADPFCGFMMSTQFWVDLLDGLAKMSEAAEIAYVPKYLPLLLISGRRDPVSGGGRGVEQLASSYRAAGMGGVAVKLYDDARHELLNETNREAVTGDILDFLARAEPAKRNGARA